MFPGCYGDGKPKLESCIHCCEPTGRAGKGEDSIYFGDIGPFCESCRDDIVSNVETERLAAAEADAARWRYVRDNMEIVEQPYQGAYLWEIELPDANPDNVDLDVDAAIEAAKAGGRDGIGFTNGW